MKLKDKVKPAVPPLEASVYMAVCVAVVDLGDQYSEKFKNTSRKVRLISHLKRSKLTASTSRGSCPSGAHSPRAKKAF